MAAPANDLFANAQLLTGSSGSVSGTTVDATEQTGEYGKGVWYKWVATETGVMSLSASTLTPYVGTEVVIHDDQQTALVWNTFYSWSGAARLSYIFEAGRTYYILVRAEYSSVTFDFTLDWSYAASSVITPTQNDLFANAYALMGNTGSLIGTNVGATTEAGEIDALSFDSSSRPSVWFKFTSPTDGTLTLTTPGSTFSTDVVVYKGQSVMSLDCVTASSYGAYAQFFARAENTYYIAVLGQYSATGLFALNWDFGAIEKPAEPPVSEQNGYIWAFGEMGWYTSGLGERVVFDVPTRLDHYGSGWKKVIVRYGAMTLLHTDGTLYHVGRYGSAFTDGLWNNFSTLTPVATEVSDVWHVGDDNETRSIIFKIGTDYFLSGESTSAIFDPLQWWADYTISTALEITSLSGLDVKNITGGYNGLWAVIADGRLYLAASSVYDGTAGNISPNDWYTLGYADGQFHQVMPDIEWAETTGGKGGYEAGVTGIDTSGQLWVTEENYPNSGWVGSYPYPYLTGDIWPPVQLGEPFPIMDTQLVPPISRTQTRNYSFGYVGADRKLYTHMGYNPLRVDSEAGWVGFLGGAQYENTMTAVAGGSGNYIIVKVTCDFDVPPGSQALGIFPVQNFQSFDCVDSWASWPDYQAIVLIDAQPPVEPGLPVFWQDFHAATETP